MLRIKKALDTNRNKFEIIAEVLRQLRMPTGRMNIMSRCNMSSRQSGLYLGFMTSNDLIRADAMAGRVTYQRTVAAKSFWKYVTRWLCCLIPAFLHRP